MTSRGNQVVVIGGGLSGLSAVHTVLENGFDVVLLEKNMFCGGNSTKATSGINGALTKVQKANNVPDSVESFLKDTALSASAGKSESIHDLGRVLVENSAGSVEWLVDKFGLDLSILGRLGGHSFPRTHRGGKRFPGMEITYALMKRYEEIVKTPGCKSKLIVKACATSLLTEDGRVVGVEYKNKAGAAEKVYGPVIIATGGFAADYTEDSLLKKVRPDLMSLPTTNAASTTGDGIKMALKIGAADVDLARVQIHPTGLINPAEPDAKTLYLAAEALRGCGAIMIDSQGERFVDELGRRDYVSEEMFKRAKPPYRLLLNTKASKEIEWHCHHYTSRGLMKHFLNGRAMAAEINVSPEKLIETFSIYNKNAQNKSDPFGKKFFSNAPFSIDEDYYVSIITPVIHYCMGGVAVDNDSCVIDTKKQRIPGLFASGEVIGGVHGINRLGGSSLLDCVVFGRLAGDSVAKYLRGEDKAAPDSAGSALKEYTMEEVAKHKTENDCWIVVNGIVLNSTTFLDDHPGGKKSIMIYAGKDATVEFNMIHEENVIEKYAPEIIIGRLKKSDVQAKL